MTQLNPTRVGLTFGAFIGLVHLVWSLLIALGLAQPLINWVSRVHMVESTHTVLPFSLVSAITLIIISSVIGFVAGFVFSTLWNKINT